MPAAIKIGTERIASITASQDPASEVIMILQDHVSSGFLDYDKVLKFPGYPDETKKPQLIVMQSSANHKAVAIIADLTYDIFEQQNGCGDDLNSTSHTSRIIYSYLIGSDEISYKVDVSQFDSSYFPGEYGG